MVGQVGRGVCKGRYWHLAAQVLLVCVAVLVMCCSEASARPLRDYQVDTWTTRHGLPHNSLRDIAQTPDGRMWFATWEGLVRYNGLEFTTIDRRSKPGLLDNGLGGLHVDAQGRLWMGDSRGNVVRYNGGGSWSRFASESPSPGVLIQAIRTDEKGQAWLLFEGKGLGRLDTEGHFHFAPPPEGVRFGLSVPRMELDNQGQVWIGTLDGLVVRDTAGELRQLRGEFGLEEGPAWPYRSSDGALWVVNGNAIFRLEAGVLSLHRRFEGISRISALLVDRNGAIWVGSESQGVMRLTPKGTIEQLPPGQQPGGRVLSLFEDREGSIWIGANGGLFRARQALFSSHTMRDGLSGDYLRAVMEDRSGRLWVGGTQGLDRERPDGRFENHPLPRLGGQPGPVSILSLAPSRAGGLWVGTYADGLIHLDADGHVRQHAAVQTLSAGNVRAMVEDDQGNLWVGSQGGLLRLRDGILDQHPLPGLPHELITALAWHDGELWIGSTEGVRRVRNGRVERIPVYANGGGRTTFGFWGVGDTVWISTDRGLYRYRNDKLRHVGMVEGLPVDSIFQMTPDRLGNVWMSTNRGILRVDMDVLSAVADGDMATLQPDQFNEIDGLANSQGNGSSGPVAVLRRDGSYWVVTAGGLGMLDPRRLANLRAHAPPPAFIEATLLDGELVLPESGVLTVGAGSRLTVDYVGLSYLYSERIRYRTRLLGLDDSWMERGRLRSVDFVGLPPGDYTLQVQARHPTGQWSNPAADLRFSVLPYWWQRHDVWAGAALLLLLAVVLLHHYATQRFRNLVQHLSGEVDQRTVDLQRQAERLLSANQDKAKLLEKLRAQAESFERQAHEDVLTGLANRRAFEDVLHRELIRCHRDGRLLCLLVLDIDHFKSVNDRFTHAVGDRVLVEVGQVLRTEARDGDMVARLGGEEFAMVLVGRELAEAEFLCARLKAAFARHVNWGGESGLKVSFSAGLIQVGREDRTPAAAFARADAVLYQAKRNGRDLTCVG